MILSKPEILKKIKQGHLKITPFEEELVGPCSVDFRLDIHFKRIKKKKAIHVREDLDYSDDFHEAFTVPIDGYVKIKPNELFLGVTKERFKLDSTLCGWIQGRSKIARLGLLVHVSSSFIQPGSDNHQVLEIVNMSPQPLFLHPFAVVGQVVFQEVKGSALYRGNFQKQTLP